MTTKEKSNDKGDAEATKSKPEQNNSKQTVPQPTNQTDTDKGSLPNGGLYG